MREEILYKIWSRIGLQQGKIPCATGEFVEIISPGRRNLNSGPDFIDSVLIIDGIRWYGNVEIHEFTSHWYAHHHHFDKAYENTLLHVVWVHDGPMKENIPVLELSGIARDGIKTGIKGLKATEIIPARIPIEFTDEVRELYCYRRLNRKMSMINGLLDETRNDWEKTLYLLLARNFGFKVNDVPFEWMARVTPYYIIRRIGDSAELSDALFFGQSGLIAGSTGRFEYIKQIRRDYGLLQKKFSVNPINGSSWKFLRMRPFNFPTLRIAQFSSFINKSDSFIQLILELPTLKELKNRIKTEPHVFWNTHFSFRRKSPPGRKIIGIKSVENIAINTVVPFLYTYGKKKAASRYCRYAVELLKSIAPESNSVIHPWSGSGMEVSNAFDTQALLQLSCDYHHPKNS